MEAVFAIGMGLAHSKKIGSMKLVVDIEGEGHRRRKHDQKDIPLILPLP
jgi:hypothetical protein